MTILLFSLMNEVSFFSKADDKTFFFPFLKKLLIKLAPISTTVNGIDSFLPNMLCHRINNFKELCIFTGKILRLL